MTRHPITTQRLIVQIPEMDRVTVTRDIPFGGDGTGKLRFDVYRPVEMAQPGLPAVVFVMGYSDSRAPELVGCNFKEWAAYMDWARLVASSGAIAITYTNENPVRDFGALVAHIIKDAEALGIDPSRLGVWSCSGNTATALALLQQHAEFRCAALCYGYLMDMPGHDDVAQAAARFGFVNATAELRIADLSAVPMLITRAGRDETPGLNSSLDRFVSSALSANLPISVINFAQGVHAFDVAEPTEEGRHVVRQILQFLMLHLRP